MMCVNLLKDLPSLCFLLVLKFPIQYSKVKKEKKKKKKQQMGKKKKENKI